MGQVNQQMQIGILEIQQYNSTILMKALNDRVDGCHVELRNMKKNVERTDIEDGAKHYSAFGSQKVIGVKFPLVLQQLGSLHGPVSEEGRNLFSTDSCLS